MKREIERDREIERQRDRKAEIERHYGIESERERKLWYKNLVAIKEFDVTNC